MNIFDHLIPDKYILGIGCLMREFKTIEGKMQLRYIFDLHLVAHTAVIKSEWFSTDPTLDQDKKAHWKDHYEVVKEQVAKIIEEPTDSRKQFEAAVDKVYKESLSTMEDLLLLLEPTSLHATAAVNLKTQRLAENIEELKALALK